MPKHRLPLNSGNVSGKMGEERVFATLRGQTYSKRFTPPKQPNTKAQKGNDLRWFRWIVFLLGGRVGEGGRFDFYSALNDGSGLIALGVMVSSPLKSFLSIPI